MKRLTVENGDVRDSDVRLCATCQKPGANYRASTGEWYHPDCRPEGV